MNNLSKEESLSLYDTSMHHAMVFTGVNLIDNKPQRLIGKLITYPYAIFILIEK